MFDPCIYWTLQLTGENQKCLLKSNQGKYVAGSNHREGGKDLDCASDNTTSSQPSTRRPSKKPTKVSIFQYREALSLGS